MHRNRKNSIILTFIIFFTASLLHAESLKNIQSFYKNHEDFTASFTQDTFQSLMNKAVHFTGKVSYKRNTGVRMDVYTPERQIIVLKDRTVIVSLPEQDTIQTQELPPEMATQNVLGFFSGLDSIGEGYEIEERDDSLFLSPKGGSGYITVWTNKAHTITRIQLKDATGNESDIRLSDYRFDSGVPDSLFRLKEGPKTGPAPLPAPGSAPAGK